MNADLLLKKLILFVDDDADDRFLYKMACKDLGVADQFHVEFATDGLDLLTLLRDSEDLPALIFLDLNMPYMNGVECLEALRELAPAAELPVVILSTSSSERDIDAAYTRKANLYLQKPTKYESIVDALRRCINRAVSDDFHIARDRFFVQAA